jgi:hypothetical protein
MVYATGVHTWRCGAAHSVRCWRTAHMGVCGRRSRTPGCRAAEGSTPPAAGSRPPRAGVRRSGRAGALPSLPTGCSERSSERETDSPPPGGVVGRGGCVGSPSRPVGRRRRPLCAHARNLAHRGTACPDTGTSCRSGQTGGNAPARRVERISRACRPDPPLLALPCAHAPAQAPSRARRVRFTGRRAPRRRQPAAGRPSRDLHIPVWTDLHISAGRRGDPET